MVNRRTTLWNGNVIALIFRALCLPRESAWTICSHCPPPCPVSDTAATKLPSALGNLRALHDCVNDVRMRGLPLPRSSGGMLSWGSSVLSSFAWLKSFLLRNWTPMNAEPLAVFPPWLPRVKPWLEGFLQVFWALWQMSDSEVCLLFWTPRGRNDSSPLLLAYLPFAIRWLLNPIFQNSSKGMELWQAAEGSPRVLPEVRGLLSPKGQGIPLICLHMDVSPSSLC